MVSVGMSWVSFRNPSLMRRSQHIPRLPTSRQSRWISMVSFLGLVVLNSSGGSCPLPQTLGVYKLGIFEAFWNLGNEKIGKWYAVYIFFFFAAEIWPPHVVQKSTPPGWDIVWVWWAIEATSRSSPTRKGTIFESGEAAEDELNHFFDDDGVVLVWVHIYQSKGEQWFW